MKYNSSSNNFKKATLGNFHSFEPSEEKVNHYSNQETVDDINQISYKIKSAKFVKCNLESFDFQSLNNFEFYFKLYKFFDKNKDYNDIIAENYQLKNFFLIKNKDDHIGILDSPNSLMALKKLKFSINELIKIPFDRFDDIYPINRLNARESFRNLYAKYEQKRLEKIQEVKFERKNILEFESHEAYTNDKLIADFKPYNIPELKLNDDTVPCQNQNIEIETSEESKVNIYTGGRIRHSLRLGNQEDLNSNLGNVNRPNSVILGYKAGASNTLSGNNYNNNQSLKNLLNKINLLESQKEANKKVDSGNFNDNLNSASLAHIIAADSGSSLCDKEKIKLREIEENLFKNGKKISYEIPGLKKEIIAAENKCNSKNKGIHSASLSNRPKSSLLATNKNINHETNTTEENLQPEIIYQQQSQGQQCQHQHLQKEEFIQQKILNHQTSFNLNSTNLNLNSNTNNTNAITSEKNNFKSANILANRKFGELDDDKKIEILKAQTKKLEEKAHLVKKLQQEKDKINFIQKEQKKNEFDKEFKTLQKKFYMSEYLNKVELEELSPKKKIPFNETPFNTKDFITPNKPPITDEKKTKLENYNKAKLIQANEHINKNKQYYQMLKSLETKLKDLSQPKALLPLKNPIATQNKASNNMLVNACSTGCLSKDEDFSVIAKTSIDLKNYKNKCDPTIVKNLKKKIELKEYIIKTRVLLKKNNFMDKMLSNKDKRERKILKIKNDFNEKECSRLKNYISKNLINNFNSKNSQLFPINSLGGCFGPIKRPNSSINLNNINNINGNINNKCNEIPISSGIINNNNTSDSFGAFDMYMAEYQCETPSLDEFYLKKLNERIFKKGLNIPANLDMDKYLTEHKRKASAAKKSIKESPIRLMSRIMQKNSPISSFGSPENNYTNKSIRPFSIKNYPELKSQKDSSIKDLDLKYYKNITNNINNNTYTSSSKYNFNHLNDLKLDKNCENIINEYRKMLNGDLEKLIVEEKENEARRQEIIKNILNPKDKKKLETQHAEERAKATENLIELNEYCLILYMNFYLII